MFAQINEAFIYEKHNNKNCVKHKVEKGQTLYSIAKKYGVEVKQIEETNDGLPDGLKKDSYIFIPASKAVVKHEVIKGETLFSISKQYSVAKADIKKDNNLDGEDLKLGQILIINLQKANLVTAAVVPLNTKSLDVNPSQLNELKKEIAETKNIPELSNDKVVIALLLPFYLDKNTFVSEEETEEGKEQKNNVVSAKSYAAIEFYEGAKLAADSFAQQKNVEIITINCENDTAGILEALRNKELSRANIVIGPFNSNYATFVADYCKKNRKIYCTPFGQQGKILMNNENAFKASSSSTTQLQAVANYIAKNYKGGNCLVVHNNLKKEKNLLEAFKQKFNSLVQDSVKQIVFKESKLVGLKNYLSATKPNIIVVCSNDQAFVTDFINKISSIKDDYNITVFGTDQWLGYENFDIEVLQDLNLHLPSNYCIDYEDENTNKFIKKFRNEFNAEPTRAAFLGYDLLSMIIINTAEETSIKSICDNKFTGLHVHFNFNKTSYESGYENEYTAIFQYQDLMLKVLEK